MDGGSIQQADGRAAGDEVRARRREVLGLVFVLTSLALLVAAVSSARTLTRASFNPSGLGTGLDAFLEVLATSTSALHVVLLGGGLVLAAARPLARSGPAARVALIVSVPLGLVVAALAAYAVVLLVTDDAARGSVTFGVRGDGLGARVGLAPLPACVAIACTYVSWCAFQHLTASAVEEASPAA